MNNCSKNFGEISSVSSMRILSQSAKNFKFSSLVKTTMCDVALFTHRNGSFLFVIPAGNVRVKIRTGRNYIPSNILRDAIPILELSFLGRN